MSKYKLIETLETALAELKQPTITFTPSKRNPLSDEAIALMATDDLYDCTYTTSVFAYKEFARKIEKAHGIGVDDE
jgi:hypothetical protein